MLLRSADTTGPVKPAATAVPTKAIRGSPSTSRGSPPGFGDATGPSSSVDPKKPPILAAHPPKRGSRKPSLRDTHQEGGGGVPTRDAPPTLPPVSPPTTGGNGHPNPKATRSVGGGTTDGSSSRPHTYSPMSRESNATASPQSSTRGEVALREFAHNELTPEQSKQRAALLLCSQDLLQSVRGLAPRDQTRFIDKVDRVRRG